MNKTFPNRMQRFSFRHGMLPAAWALFVCAAWPDGAPGQAASVSAVSAGVLSAGGAFVADASVAGVSVAGASVAGASAAASLPHATCAAGASLASIRNPFHSTAEWRLWAQDSTSVTVTVRDKEVTLAPIPPEERRYPDLASPATVEGAPPLIPMTGTPAVAGSWDDCYLSLDGAHSNLRAPQGQFLIAPPYLARDGADTPVELLRRLGVNFTSQSYSRRGRQIVDDFANNDNTERNCFFANVVRATPAYRYYMDADPAQNHDEYDGLYGHSYQSVGQSGSEIHGLYKMMMAGAAMPRATKDLLKRHGLYAPALLTLFKAALPYCEASGAPLPYEHELRHRPAYSSSGNVDHAHFCPANVHYHGYDEARHLRAMTEMAARLDTPPPVAVVKLIDFSVRKEGKTLVDRQTADERLKSVNATLIRIWGNEGETLEARVDLGASYDLLDRPLEFHAHRLYPLQSNVRIQAENAKGVYRITAAHDPAIPKGRLPVLLFATCGAPIPSNPVFVNFYWPGPGELADYPHGDRDDESEDRDPATSRTLQSGSPALRVNCNDRPVVETGLRHDTVVCAGDRKSVV